MRGIKSDFLFDTYKVDTIHMEMSPLINNLIEADKIPNENWEFMVNFRPPRHYAEDNIYVGGLEFSLRLVEDSTAKDATEIVKIDTGIAGIFRATAELPKETEERLVKFQIPTILMPYLRATITSLLASAGYGSVILPLINMIKLAEEKSDQLEIIRN